MSATGVEREAFRVGRVIGRSLHFQILVWPDLLLSAFGAALWAIVGTVAYHDLRASREGPDCARVATGFD